LIRLIDSLGAKEDVPPLQVFITTHSPVALRELKGEQLWVSRVDPNTHDLRQVGSDDAIQSTIRIFPEAFLAPTVIVCEGASEVGLIRGLDQYRVTSGEQSFAAQGVALIDCGGGSADRPFQRATAFQSLGYRTAIVRDDDTKPSADVQTGYTNNGGHSISWREGRALEDELFASLSDSAVEELLQRAIDLHGEDLIDSHIKSTSDNKYQLQTVKGQSLIAGFDAAVRIMLGKASRRKKAGWFKSVTWMEGVAKDIVGPDLPNADEEFKQLIDSIFTWIQHAG